MAANTAEVRETALSLDAAFSAETAAPVRPAHIARGRQESRHVHVRRDHTRIVAAALIVLMQRARSPTREPIEQKELDWQC